MKLNSFKSLLWLILIGILGWFSAGMPALADGGGWPTATSTTTPIRLVTATSPFGGAVTPVIAITPLGKDQPRPARDEALQPTMFSAVAQETTKTSGSLLIVGILGLVITAGLLAVLLLGFMRRNRE